MFSALFGSSASSSPESGGDAHVAEQLTKRLATLRAIPSEKISALRAALGDAATTESDLDLATWLYANDGDVEKAATRWRAGAASRASYGAVTIADVAPFLRAPSAARRLPDGAVVCLEDMAGGVARDRAGRPIIAVIGSPHGTADEQQRQFLYAVERAHSYCLPEMPSAAQTVVLDVVPAEAGAPPTFRFPDRDMRTTFDMQSRLWPGHAFSTTHFCGLPRFVVAMFRLVKPFMAKSAYEAMVLKPSFAHLPGHIDAACMLRRWGGELDFDLDAYVEWRAAEEGIAIADVCARGGGRAYDKRAAEAASVQAARESLASGGGGTITAKALCGADADPPPRKHGVASKRGSGSGLFSTLRWKAKLLCVAELGVVYFDGAAPTDDNKASRVIAWDGSVRAERCDADGKGPAAQFAVRTAARDYLFGVDDAKEADEWVAAVNAQAEAAAAERPVEMDDGVSLDS